MQESGFRSRARLDDVLEVAGLVVCDLALGVSVAGARDEDRDVDDEGDELFGCGLEAGYAAPRALGRPDVGRGVFFEARVLLCVGALEGGVLVEGAVDVVGALLGVEDARAEGFDAVGPADEVFGGRVGEGLEGGGREGCEVGGGCQDAGAEGREMGWEISDDEDAEGGRAEGGEECGEGHGVGFEGGEGDCDWIACFGRVGRRGSH